MNRFENKTLDEIIGEMWFGDDDPREYTYEEYEEYIWDLYMVFPEAHLNEEEIGYLFSLNPN